MVMERYTFVVVVVVVITYHKGANRIKWVSHGGTVVVRIASVVVVKT